MAKSKKRQKRFFFRRIHFLTLIVLIIYSIISKTIFLKSIVSENIVISYLAPYSFGVIMGMLFLYFFSHEDFFHFIKQVEKEEAKVEHKLLKKYKHYGKIVAVFIISTIGGPILAALTIRFLLGSYAYKYFVMIIAMLFSTFASVGIAKGFLFFVF